MLGDPRRVGKRLRERRLERGLSLDQLADATGKSVSALSRYELGEQVLRLDVLQTIVTALGWASIEDFMSGEAVLAVEDTTEENTKAAG